jgi:hypothetical protein
MLSIAPLCLPELFAVIKASFSQIFVLDVKLVIGDADFSNFVFDST